MYRGSSGDDAGLRCEMKIIGAKGLGISGTT